MASLLSNLNNLAEAIRKIKCKYGHMMKNIRHAELNTNIAGDFLNTKTLKMI